MTPDYFSSHANVVEHRLASSTIKTYTGCINKLKEKMTPAQRAEYVLPNGWLLKPLESDLASEIVHRNQVKLVENGENTFKSKTCCEQYIARSASSDPSAIFPLSRHTGIFFATIFSCLFPAPTSLLKMCIIPNNGFGRLK